MSPHSYRKSTTHSRKRMATLAQLSGGYRDRDLAVLAAPPADGLTSQRRPSVAALPCPPVVANTDKPTYQPPCPPAGILLRRSAARNSGRSVSVSASLLHLRACRCWTRRCGSDLTHAGTKASPFYYET